MACHWVKRNNPFSYLKNRLVKHASLLECFGYNDGSYAACDIFLLFACHLFTSFLFLGKQIYGEGTSTASCESNKD